MIKKKYLLLIVILITAAFLRFYQLGINPPSLNWDEAAWGYNAYSLGIDGKDEFGKFLPITFIESFGDFKPPLYAYLAVIPVKLLGLTETAVRIPSALFGTLTVLVVYFLTIQIFSNKNKKKENKSKLSASEWTALLAALFLAISPWHINLSRAAFEANVASFFLITGVWLFLFGIQKKPIFLVISTISFVVSMYTFNTARIVAPLLFIGLSIGFYKALLTYKKEVILAGFIGFIILLPLIPFLISPQASLRFKEVNIFSDGSVVASANQQIQNDQNAWWSKILHNRRVLYGLSYIRHYFDNLNPSFLFIRGDGNPKFSIQDVGQLYIWDIPFLVVGLLLLIRRREGVWWIIPYWIVVGIIPAATARETPHALRIETIIPTLQILTAYGFFSVAQNIFKITRKIFNIQIKYAMLSICLLLLFVNILYYLHGYYAHYPREYSAEWQYGYKESLAYVLENENKFTQIHITDELGRPYIYYLFYSKTDPKEFQKNATIEREAFGFVHVNQIGKYHFGADLEMSETPGANWLYIGKVGEIPSGVKILKTFYLLNGDPILVAYTR